MLLSRAVNDPDGFGPPDTLEGVLDVRSSLRGRWRELADTSGEDGGSFFTMILGGRADRDRLTGKILASSTAGKLIAIAMIVTTYELGDNCLSSGEDRGPAASDVAAADVVAGAGDRRSPIDTALWPGDDATLICDDLGLRSCRTCECWIEGATADATAVGMICRERGATRRTERPL